MVVRPIEASQFIHETRLQQTPVGIVPKQCTSVSENEEIDVADSEVDMEMTINMYSAICSEVEYP